MYVLVSFAAAVIVTRSFLEWMGYPQIATGEFHMWWQQMGATSTPLAGGGPFGATHLYLASATLIFEGVIGGLFLAATGLLLTRRVQRGLAFGYWGLLLSLTAVRLLAFYFSQFDIIFTTLFQFGLLLGVQRYRSAYTEA